MNRKAYIRPTVEIEQFDLEDTLTASSVTEPGDDYHGEAESVTLGQWILD